jgi:GMP synthase (glutamine-hydrolysing)
MLLFIKHIDIEGPGTAWDFFKEAVPGLKVIELQSGDQLPEDLSDIEGAVILGGPMNVYDEGTYPFLKVEDIFLKEAISRDIPLLGICLGAQLIAKAAGASVTKAPVKEIGWSNVYLTAEGYASPLFAGLGHHLRVFQWHEDTFDVPRGGQLLATGAWCHNQAFRIGTRSYGVQFHIEVTDDMIKSWAQRYDNAENKQDLVQTKKMLERYVKEKEIFDRQARIVYGNFLRILSTTPVGR